MACSAVPLLAGAASLALLVCVCYILGTARDPLIVRATTQPVRHRFEPVKIGNATVVDSTPDAFIHGLVGKSSQPVLRRFENKSSQPVAWLKQEWPDLMIQGVQKGGTSTLRYLLQQIGGCSWERELHFFDNERWAVMAVPLRVLVRDYGAQFNHCAKGKKKNTKKLFTFEKSPASYTKPWVPMRIRESFPDQKVAIILRNPTDRAYSGFWECYPFMSKKQNWSDVPERVFDKLVRLEVAIVKACGAPAGNGNFNHDWSLAANFSTCCNIVAERHGQVAWAGCRAYGYGQPHQAPDLIEFLRDKNESRRGQYWSGGAFGDYCWEFVRQGLYIEHLRSWYTHLPAKNILLIPSSSLFQDPGKVLRLLVQFATSSSVDLNTESRIKQASESPIQKTNSKSTKHEGMLEDTRKLLDAFYSPFNHRLRMQYGVSV